MLIHNNTIFVGPMGMILALMELVRDNSFWASISSPFARISIGFLGAFVPGIFLGGLIYVSGLVKELLEPIMLLIRSVPVASFVILALIWIGSHNLSVFTSFLAVIPMIYVSTPSGLEHTDRKLLEMTGVFSMPLYKRVWYIYIPGLPPYLISGYKAALSMGWEPDVTAGVIGIPEDSIGGQLYYSRLYLDTAGLFVWTLVIIIVNTLLEHLFLYLLKRVRH